MKKQKNHIEEEDNTFFVAGAVAIFLAPIIILGIKMANYYYNQTPSVEPLGSFPELFKAAIFYLIVITAIPIPIIIVILGAFTGCFRKKKSENNNTKQTE